MGKNLAKRKIELVEMSGTHYEMGLQYGSTCPKIKEMVRMMIQNLEMDLTQVKAFTNKYALSIQGYDPEIMDEIRGIAKGAGVDLEEILFLCAWYEMAIHKFVTSLPGCTSFAAMGDATVDGELFIGQNMDIYPAIEDKLILLKMKPNKGPDILALTIVGAVGLIGINSEGISVNGNLLMHRNYVSPIGIVPHNVISRKTMSANNLSKVISSIALAKRGPAVNQLFGSSQGDVIDVEVTPDDLGFVYPVDGILTHANNFVTERFKSGDIASAFVPDSFIRIKRLDTLMREHKGRLSIELMKKLLQDHNNYPDSICRHADEELPPNMRMKTVASIITSPKERKMHIALGNPCQNEYVEYSL